MSFALGFMSGLGEAAHERSQLQYKQDMEAEQSANEGVVNMLKGIMASDSSTPEMKNSALESLQQFYRTPGMPKKKHRMQAMEPVLRHFNTPRQAPDAQHLESMARDEEKQPFDPNNPDSGQTYTSTNAGGGTEQTPVMAVDPRTHAQAIRKVEGMVPERHGFLGADEQAMKRGTAMGIQTRAFMDAGGAGSGSGGSTSGKGYKTVYLTGPDGKPQPHIIRDNKMPVEATYTDPLDGEEHQGLISYDHNTGAATVQEIDGSERPVKATHLRTRDGWMVLPGVNAAGSPTKEVVSKSDAADRGPAEQFVHPQKITNPDNTESFVNPVTGVHTASAGVKQTDVQKTRTQAGTNAANVGVDIKKKDFAIRKDPASYPGGVDALPPGQPIVRAPDGTQVVTGIDQYKATREPATVLQRASTGRNVVTQGTTMADEVEKPENADLFGKVQGRINQMFVRGPHGIVGFKWVGPIGTNDPRLTKIYAGLKSISDLLTTVHGRRAELSAQEFFDTMQLVNSPQALAAAVRQYVSVAQQIANEGERPTTPVTTGKGGTVPERKGKDGAATAKSRLSLSDIMGAGKQK